MTKHLEMQLAVPTGNLESYIHASRSIPMLSVDEERELATRLQDEGDLDAAQQLVLSHLRFVIHVARGYSGYGLPQATTVPYIPTGRVCFCTAARMRARSPGFGGPARSFLRMA